MGLPPGRQAFRYAVTISMLAAFHGGRRLPWFPWLHYHHRRVFGHESNSASRAARWAWVARVDSEPPPAGAATALELMCSTGPELGPEPWPVLGSEAGLA